jgi:hypothetical protein
VKKNISRVFLILLFLVLAGWIGYSLYSDAKEEQNVGQIDEELAQKASKYEKEKNEILEKEEELRMDAVNPTLEDAYVMFAFDSTDEDLYESIYPKLKKYGWTGMIILDANEKGYGALTKKQYASMIKDGWEVAYGGVMPEDIQELQERIEQEKQNSILYFDDGEDYANNDKVLGNNLAQMGIGYFALSDTETTKKNLTSGQEGTDLFRIQNIRVGEETTYTDELLKLLVNAAGTEQGVVVLTNYGTLGSYSTFGLPTTYEEESFSHILKNIYKKVKKNELKVTTFNQYVEAKEELREKNQKIYDDYKEEQEPVVNELESNIKEIWEMQTK